MDWIFILFIGVFAVLLLLIVVFLFSLSKQGDERFDYVKTKAMANAFLATVGAVIGRLCYAVFTDNQINAIIANLSLLIVIAIIFLISLIWHGKKENMVVNNEEPYS